MNFKIKFLTVLSLTLFIWAMVITVKYYNLKLKNERLYESSIKEIKKTEQVKEIEFLINFSEQFFSTKISMQDIESLLSGSSKEKVLKKFSKSQSFLKKEKINRTPQILKINKEGESYDILARIVDTYPDKKQKKYFIRSTAKFATSSANSISHWDYLLLEDTPKIDNNFIQIREKGYAIIKFPCSAEVKSNQLSEQIDRDFLDSKQTQLLLFAKTPIENQHDFSVSCKGSNGFFKIKAVNADDTENLYTLIRKLHKKKLTNEDKLRKAMEKELNFRVTD